VTLTCAKDGPALVAQDNLVAAGAGVIPATTVAASDPCVDEAWNATNLGIGRLHERAEGIEFKNIMGKDHADSFLLLETGRADAFVMDGSILAGNISKSKNAKDFKIVGEPLSTEPIACMVRKNDPAFLKAVNDSIARQVKDGTLAKLWDKWFIQPIPPANVAVGLPLSEATKNAWNNPNNKPKEDYNK
jgi:glutamate/aspartate transport system substrate-binding protein